MTKYIDSSYRFAGAEVTDSFMLGNYITALYWKDIRERNETTAFVISTNFPLNFIYIGFYEYKVLTEID